MSNIFLPGDFFRTARGFMFVDGGGVTWSYDHQTNQLSAAVASGGVAGFNESVDDRVATLIQNGTGLTWTYVDGSNTLTGNVSLASFSTANLTEGSNLYFTDERAQDAVAAMFADSSRIDFTYNDAGNSFTADLKTNSVENTHLRQSGGLSVIGRAGNTTGDVADITAGADDRVLSRAGSALGFNQLTVGMAPNALWTYAKIQNVAATARVLGRISAGAGVIEELTATDLTSLLQAITPTWSGVHAWTRTVAGAASYTFTNTDGGAGSYVELNLKNNANRLLGFFYMSSAFSGAALAGGPSGEQAGLYTSGTYPIAIGTNGTARINIGGNGELGFNAPAIARPVVSGSRVANPALASLITALANLGLITDSTTI